MSKRTKTKLLVLAAVLIVGGADSLATWIRGEHQKALGVLGLTAGIALFLLLADRSERLGRRLLGTDERSNAISLFAGAWAGFAIFPVIFVMYLVEFARGHSGEPYYWLSLLYEGAFVVFALARRVRR
ncbi:MAG: hypothetical protein ABSC51_04040 [Gaiellaceae bacterium]|jgi:hypothetical protein